MIKDFEISEEEIKKQMDLPGKTRGFKGDMDYVLGKKGIEGLRVVEDKMERLGWPVKYQELSETKWYPVGLSMLSLYSMLFVFDWGKKELAELAESTPKTSFITKFFMRYFVSPEKMFRVAAPIMWRKYFSIGSLEPISFKRTEKDGCAVLRINDFTTLPFYCFFLGHFLVGAFRLAAQFKKVSFEETKCVFKGDKCHEYLIKWFYF